MNVFIRLKKIYLRLEDWTEYRLRCLCGKPSPLKRFIMVLTAGLALTAGYLWLVASSIYNMGKRDAEKEFIKLQPIESVQLQSQQKNDSINILNSKEYEYE